MSGLGHKSPWQEAVWEEEVLSSETPEGNTLQKPRLQRTRGFGCCDSEPWLQP